MIVQESDDDEQHAHAPSADASAGAGNAFMSAQRGVDGASRDAKGNLKFNKNTKRAREMEREDDAMDLDELIGDKKEKKKKREVVRLGSEFKAKVGRRYFTCFVRIFSPCGSPKGRSGRGRARSDTQSASVQVLTRAASRRGYQTPGRTRPLLLHPDRSGRAEQEGRRAKGLAHEQEEGLEGVMRMERACRIGIGSGLDRDFGCSTGLSYVHAVYTVLQHLVGYG
jgi:hypothetical protein